MKTIDHTFLRDMINALLARPEMYAHDCISLSEQFHTLYGLWCDCHELPQEHLKRLFDFLCNKYPHGNLFFGSKFTNRKELASVFGDALFEFHGWESVDPAKDRGTN